MKNCLNLILQVEVLLIEDVNIQGIYLILFTLK